MGIPIVKKKVKIVLLYYTGCVIRQVYIISRKQKRRGVKFFFSMKKPTRFIMLPHEPYGNVRITQKSSSEHA